ncbi:[protein-PII] uridylyltransferase [Candidatus Magnetomonas plexicatena]|uniref:[protein-PII] uridylyltransferase n=1 Tax=Candidatus Magnetomonas plexicatena TaxID=2552947 RepID=UPI0011027C8A|nr:[protein-PII] uridylyltransferase [Nitrospirales bacterium LBB_01]
MDFLNELREMLSKGCGGLEIVKRHSALMDDFIKEAAPDGIFDQPVAVFAIGGYGRAELAPYSDVDLMFLIEDRADPAQIAIVEEFYYKLLNERINISHSVRTVSECVEESRLDLRTRTSLLDGRFLTGNKLFSKVFYEKIHIEVLSRGKRAYFTDRVNEMRKRLEKYGTSPFMLEPNVKESQGGLRDVHDALWIAKTILDLNSLDDLKNIMDEYDFKILTAAYDFVLKVRITLHLVSGRENDVLSFNHQSETAALLGIRQSRYFSASERLMRLYYLRAGTVRTITARVRNIAGSVYLKLPGRYNKVKINGTFSTVGNKMMLNRPVSLKREPHVILESYALYSRTGKDFTGFLNELIKTHLVYVNSKLRTDKISTGYFLDVFKGQRVYETLKLMHTDGVLGRFIPEFGALNYLVVHEPYHIYTVDEHSLYAIKNLEELLNPKNSRQRQIGEIFQTFPDKHLLYLTLLLHDIGKSKGYAHSAEGYKKIKPVLERLGLKKHDRETVEFLVRYHILMSKTAFTKDIEDSETLAVFADTVKNQYLLTAILLVTYSDMSAVNPEFMTNWRLGLLVKLYKAAESRLRDGKLENSVQLQALTKLLANQLYPDISKEEIEEFIKSAPERYLFLSTGERILKDFSWVKEFSFAKGNPVIRFEQIADTTTELTIVASDRAGLLASIVGALSSRRLNIISLRTFTMQLHPLIEGDFVIDKFQLSNYSTLWWEGMDEVLTEELTQCITGKKLPELKRYPHKNGRFSPFVDVDNETSAGVTVFEIMSSDRIGLLYDITRLFSNRGVNIISALVNTEWEIAHDTFYVSEGRQNLPPEQIMTLTSEIWNTLSS